MASIDRRLSEDGNCPCTDGFVKLDTGEWVQPTEAEAAEAGYVKADEVINKCGCVSWVKAEGSRRLFPCEDATDSAAATLAADLSMSHGSCAELRAAGECDRDIVKQKCAASCDACGAAAPPRELYGCEDAADEVVAATSEEAMGTRIEGCAELVAVMGDGACGHELL